MEGRLADRVDSELSLRRQRLPEIPLQQRPVVEWFVLAVVGAELLTFQVNSLLTDRKRQIMKI